MSQPHVQLAGLPCTHVFVRVVAVPVVIWDVAVSAFALYNAIYVPLALAMPAARWSDHGSDAVLEYCLDAAFLLDVLLRFRVSFRDHGVCQ